ncbi:MAG: heme NO-binding domain-containing protein [Alphaproteobacteria bacterium]
MKGIVFTAFLDRLDADLGPDVTEAVIVDAAPASGGAYTEVGAYDHGELVALVRAVSARTGRPVGDLIRDFGRHMLGCFHDRHPAYFAEPGGLLAFLERVDGRIHAEVRRPHPGACLPEIRTRRLGADSLELTYRSERHLGDFAEGLIAGAVDRFGATHTVERTDLQQEGGRQCISFTLTPAPPNAR